MVDVMIGFAGNILAKVLESLIVVTGRELKYVINYHDNIATLREQVNQLKGKLVAIDLKVEEAKKNQEDVLPAVDNWCRKAKEICDRIEGFMIKVEVPANKEICLSKMKKLYSLSRKAKKMTQEAATLKDDAMLNMISDPSTPRILGDTSKHFRNFESRSPTIERLMKLLKDETTQIISICGMGGTGKTTMVEEVIRRVEGEKLFDKITKARVSKEHDLAKVQEELAYYLRLKLETRVENTRADELRKQLDKGKKGNLVVLDDVWKEINLENIGIPSGHEYKNCKVILTSRNEEVCQKIGCDLDHILILDKLTQPETLSLMQEMVGDDKLHEQSDFRDTAIEIASKCGGLPIAIVCLGRILKNKAKEVWNDTLNKLQTSMVPANLDGVKEAVYKSLQVSYDLLEDEETKKTFLICCLYPEYANIPLEALVRCMFGLNIYQNINGLIDARNRVHALTDTLISHSLLLRGDRKSTVKVHNVVRSVGISMASTILKPNVGSLSALIIHKDRWPIGIKYGYYDAVSIVSDEISELPSDGLIFQNLGLLQLACPKLSSEILEKMLEGINSLRVFDIWNMSLSSLSPVLKCLPSDIISLSIDCNIENIGDIKAEKIANLAILSLGKCNIKELPEGIGKFQELRQLDMSGCHCLERIPTGVIKSLLKLEELDTGSMLWGDEKKDEASLTELESLKNLKYLGILIKSSNLIPKNSFFEKLERYVISVGADREKRCSFNNRMLRLKLEKDANLGDGIKKLLQKNTEKVHLTGDGIKTALNVLLPGGFQRLKSITVKVCQSVETEYLSDYKYSDNVFSSLEKLHLEKMTHLKGISRHDGQGVPVTYFSRLRKIHLSVLPEMTYLFTLSVALSLLQLESLHIENCKKLQQVVLNPRPSASASAIENKIVFPKLTNLILNSVDSLTGFSQGINLQIDFPRLKVLKVEKLQKFKTFCSDETNPTTQLQYNKNMVEKFKNLFHDEIFPKIKRQSEINNQNLVEKFNIFCSNEINPRTQLQSLVNNKSLVEKFKTFCSNEINPTTQFQSLVHNKILVEKFKTFCSNEIIPTILSQSLADNLNLVEKFKIFCFNEIDPTTQFQPLVNNKDLGEIFKTFCSDEIIPTIQFQSMVNNTNLIEKFKTFQSNETNPTTHEKLVEKFETFHSNEINPTTHEKLVEKFDTFHSNEINPTTHEKLVEKFETFHSNEINPTTHENLVEKFETFHSNEINPTTHENLEEKFNTFCSNEINPKAQLQSLVNNKNLVEKFKSFGFNEIIPAIQFQYQPNIKNLVEEFKEEIIPIIQFQPRVNMRKPVEIFKTCCSNEINPKTQFQSLVNDKILAEKLKTFCNNEINSTTQFQSLVNDKNLVEKFKTFCYDEIIPIIQFQPQANNKKLVDKFKMLSSKEINLAAQFESLVYNKKLVEKFKTFCSEEIIPAIQFQPLVNNKVKFSSLADLTITSLNIKQVWHGQSGDVSNQAELQGLYIEVCHQMEEVISIQRRPSVTTTEEGIQFSKLKEIILSNMDRLALFCKGIDHLEFPQLRVLRLQSLKRFQTFCSEDTTGHLPDLFNDKVMFPSLETLEISELESVEVLWSTKLPSNHFGKLMHLKVNNCHKLLNIFPSDLQMIFPYLERLEVKGCNSLEQVWGDNRVQFQNLKSVYVCECPKLRNLCSFYTFKGFSNLQVADISRCKLMEAVVEDDHSNEKTTEVLYLNKMEEVKLESLTNLIYFCQTKCDMELRELNQVIVKGCPEMQTFSQSSVSTPNLEFPLLDGKKYWSSDLNRAINLSFESGMLVADLKRLEENTMDDPPHDNSVAKRWILDRLRDINETMYYKVRIGKSGMYFSAGDHGDMRSMVYEWPAVSHPVKAEYEVDMIIVTDGSRILGLGDDGVQEIRIAKEILDLYVKAGINPQRVLPIMIDVETKNEALLKDSSYLGLQQKRVDGNEYIAIIDEFMEAVFTRWPHVIVQFEDFQSKWAFKLLQRYRYSYRMFNNDIQGTAAVAIAGLLGAVRAQDKPMIDSTQKIDLLKQNIDLLKQKIVVDLLKKKIVFAGSGSAKIGVLNAAMRTMSGNNKLAYESARSRFWVIDAKGLVTEERENVDEDTKLFARKTKETASQGLREGASLAEVVRVVKPDVLFGLAGIGGLFSKEVLEALKESTSTRPTIFAMSNPTTNAECTPEEAFSIVGDNVIFASGSPFTDVDLGNGHIGHSNQGNNMYLFPGIALGTLLSGSRVVSYGMLQAAAECLAAYMTEEEVLKGIIYPSMSSIRDITKQVAAEVISAAIEEGLAKGYRKMNARLLSKLNKDEILYYVENNMWNPEP